MHTRLREEYPDLALQSIYQDGVPEYPECSPIFEVWAKKGVDLIVGTAYGHQYCMQPLAWKYPNTMWLAITGDVHPNISNWATASGRIYQPTYLAGIIAGHATRTGRVGCVMPYRMADTRRQLAAFALGVAHFNASYEVHVGWTNSWNSPRHEILGTNALAGINADVVFYRVDGIEGLKQAIARDMRAIGVNADDRMLLGESVLTSPYYNWGVIYLQIARMVLLGTFESSSPIDLFLGMQEGVVALSAPSFLVRRCTLRDVGVAAAAILNGSDPFCGAFRTNRGTTVGAPGKCLNDTELDSIAWQPHNVIDHGFWLLPSEVCTPGSYAVWANETWTWTCRLCPAGTRSSVLATATNETMLCVPCGVGTVARAGSASCMPCAPGTAPSARKDGCVQCPADTYSEGGASCVLCPGSLQSKAGSDHCWERPEARTSLGVVIGVVGASAGISVLLVGWVLYQRHSATSALLHSAPRGPVAIMFVNVHSSVTLWDRYPEATSWAFNQYNLIVRNLVAEFDGYEVRAMGDVFMVVFQRAADALQCAMRIQEDLLKQHWPLELQQEPACCMQKDLQNEVIWNGPRVRTGIHFGAPELVVNRLQERVDFLGPAVHLAAQVEVKASGGQTLVTEDLRRRIPADVLARYDVQPVGRRSFKGVPQPLELFSVLPGSLAARAFTEQKENVCLRCDGPTVCPNCDAALDHDLLRPARAAPPPGRARPQRVPSMAFYKLAGSPSCDHLP
eukprot:EG_transcript_2136